MALKKNIDEYVKKSHIKTKRKKLVVKGNVIANKFNDKCFINNKTKY
jgi:hypothetical protein